MKKLTAEELEYFKKQMYKDKRSALTAYKDKITGALTTYENISTKCAKGYHNFVQASDLSEFKCNRCECAFPSDSSIPEDMTPADYVKNQFEGKGKEINVKFVSTIIQYLKEMNDSGLSESLDALTYTNIRRFLFLILTSKVNVGAVLAIKMGGLENAKDTIIWRIIMLEDYSLLTHQL